MTEERFTPDEFARLLSLPDDHPDRQRAERTPQFQAWCQMLQEFERPSNAPLPAAEIASAGRELEARLARGLGRAQPNGAGEAGPRPTSGRTFADSFAAWFRGPTMRPALAFAAVAVVAGFALWSASRPPAPRAVRGSGESAVLAVGEPRAISGGIELTWTQVDGAETYRVVFYGGDLRENARVDGLTEPRLRLQRNALPAGLTPGADVLAEVMAMRHGDPIATSKTRAIHLP
jgi:hypothetical protein